ncbi:MAG: hypothetical protein CL623_01875 [Arcobacter sp.]|nr:hypothetical protein [Arcobacter sp.]|tara:strand:- start:16595 stop:17197 length:603 start_codon:yes stop_codon:yes gene_type:complete
MSNKKVVNKRLDSTKKYIDALQDKYSKLNVVRVDLSYKKPYSDDITLDDANNHFNRMLNNRRSKPSIFDNQVGYICKKEYTKDKGMHFHTIFFYDGQKIKNDTNKAIAIGKYWKEDITEKKGSYHNCNIKAKKEYGDKNGVGMLEHKDIEKRKNLDIAVNYLCKDDGKQDIAPVKSNMNDRAFARGRMPSPKSNMGRPRT